MVFDYKATSTYTAQFCITVKLVLNLQFYDKTFILEVELEAKETNARNGSSLSFF